MSVWYITPSCRPLTEANGCFCAWQEMGYKVAVLRQGEPINPAYVDIQIPVQKYMGLPRSINWLAAMILMSDASAEWMVHGGDDVYPDPRRRATELGHECSVSFAQRASTAGKTDCLTAATFGVMQPTGDRGNGGNIDTAAAHAWMGREWCLRMYGRRGPAFEGYYHHYWDRELQEVAQYRGVFMQRPDIFQEHRHYSRDSKTVVPSHMRTPLLHLDADAHIFMERQALNFPGHAPVPVLL